MLQTLNITCIYSIGNSSSLPFYHSQLCRTCRSKRYCNGHLSFPWRFITSIWTFCCFCKYVILTLLNIVEKIFVVVFLFNRFVSTSGYKTNNYKIKNCEIISYKINNYKINNYKINSYKINSYKINSYKINNYKTIIFKATS